MEDFHFNDKEPEEKIIELVVSLASLDNTVDHFGEAINIIQLIQNISSAHERTYKEFDHDLNQVLSIYHKKVAALLKMESHETIESLSTFFAIFHNDPTIKSVIEQDQNSSIPFSSHQSLKATIDNILALEKKYNKSQKLNNEKQGQQAYSQLLLKVLEGDTSAPLIQLGTSHEVEHSTTQHLLPDSEFPVPQAEPEHPDYIGINRTMNFNPEPKHRSTLELFSSVELKKDFCKHFPGR